MKRATPDLLENLLLCDPVTERGREKLDSLGLLEIISPEVFFQQTGGFCVPQAELIAYPDDEDNPEYDTTPTAQRIRLIRERREEFNARFHVTSRRSKERREFTVLMGVCGAGKSRIAAPALHK